jgi:hypothetical protein
VYLEFAIFVEFEGDLRDHGFFRFFPNKVMEANGESSLVFSQ